MSRPENDASKWTSLRQAASKYPYTPSIASSASSSFSSVWSADAQSSQSSAPSSVKSAAANWETEGISSTSETSTNSHVNAAKTNGFLIIDSTQSSDQKTITIQRTGPCDVAVAPELRIHPRRTQTQFQVESRDGQCNTRQPPALVRQCDRKDRFVECLVGRSIQHSPVISESRSLLFTPYPKDTTTQMIEVIWPLSVFPCGRDAILGGKNLIGLRTFIEEVLKRSKTSYSTLQVALYYLVLIKPWIPKVDFTKEQHDDSHASRAMQCGRRMFLAALILASKYLQDRNYSARAWSKISGLKVSEINTNEMAFVAAVNWKLHIPEPLFQRWTDIVLKFAPPQSSHAYSSGCEATSKSWRSIIPRLTPGLDDIDITGFSKMSLESKPETPVFPFSWLSATPVRSGFGSPDSAPCGDLTPIATKPEALEPTPRASKETFRFPPISPRITQLPTPQMTPRTNGFYTPAASVGGFCPSRPSMCSAMRQIQNLAMARCTVDTWPNPGTAHDLPFKRITASTRRSSLAPSLASTISSPESMISDLSSQSSQSSRSSRSSSICSLASSAGALPQPKLAVQATRRCATLQMACLKEREQWETRTGCAPDEISASPLSMLGVPRESFVRGNENCKEYSETAAAFALRDLACAKSFCTPPLPRQQTCVLAQRKRERPSSISDFGLEADVRALLPECLADLRTNDDAAVAEDPCAADTFLLKENFRFPQELDQGSRHHRSTSGSSSDGARKRMCCKEQAWPKANDLIDNHGPGMWDGVL